MKTSIHYRMVYTSELLSDDLRKSGANAWHIYQVIVDDDNDLVISRQPVAIFNMDSEALTFQRFLIGGGTVEVADEVAELQRSREQRIAERRAGVCHRCRGAGVLETGNNDIPCDCPAGDNALFNVAGATMTGAQIKSSR